MGTLILLHFLHKWRLRTRGWFSLSLFLHQTDLRAANPRPVLLLPLPYPSILAFCLFCVMKIIWVVGRITTRKLSRPIIYGQLLTRCFTKIMTTSHRWPAASDYRLLRIVWTYYYFYYKSEWRSKKIPNFGKIPRKWKNKLKIKIKNAPTLSLSLDLLI